MFELKLVTEDETLLEYLSVEGTIIDEQLFAFTSVDKASNALGIYVYYDLKMRTLKKLMPETEYTKDDVESFLSFIPYDLEEAWLNQIIATISEYLHNDDTGEMYLEGFINFRLGVFRRKFLDYMEYEYAHYIQATEPSSSLETLIEFMKTNPSKYDEISIVTHENGDIVVKSLEEYIYVEQEDSQEDVIVQSVFAVPKKVKVIDKFEILKKESIIVLKQLFGRNITFDKRVEV